MLAEVGNGIFVMIFKPILMKDLKFKTNINCGGCVAKVTPFLNQEAGICEWKVDTTNAQKVLTISTDSLTENKVITIIEAAGFKAEKV